MYLLIIFGVKSTKTPSTHSKKAKTGLCIKCISCLSYQNFIPIMQSEKFSLAYTFMKVSGY